MSFKKFSKADLFFMAATFCAGYFFLWLTTQRAECCDDFYKSAFYFIWTAILFFRYPSENTNSTGRAVALCISYLGILNLFHGTHNTIPYHWPSQVITRAGVTLLAVSVYSLGKSFGLRPAIRKIQTGGVYKFIRHPIYLAFLLIHTGTVLHSMSKMNWILFGLLIVFTFLMIENEEKFLIKNSQDFHQYMQKTRYKLLPKIY